MYPDLITQIQKLEAELNLSDCSPAGRAQRLVEVGRLYERNGRDQQAANVWIEAISLADIHAPTADLLVYAGHAHVEMGQLSEAQSCYERAAQLDPSHPLPPVGLAEAARQQGHLAHAMVVLQQAADDYPDVSAIHSALGNLYKLLNKPERAAAQLQLAVDSDYRWTVPPDTSDGEHKAHMDRQRAVDYLRLGTVCTALGRETEAVAAFEAALACRPDFAPPHNSLGAIYARNGAYDKAIHHFEQALIIGNLPHEVLARIYNGLGNVYYLVGRLDEAVDVFQQAVALNYRYARPYNGLGNVYRAQGRFDKARQMYERAAELDPGYGAPFCGLATIFSLENEIRPAIVAYQKAIARDPRDPVAYCGLAALYRAHGRDRDADIQLEIAAPLVQHETLYNQACYAAVAGQEREALDRLDEALRRTPGLRAWAKWDPDFATVRDDPRFRNIVGTGDPAVNSATG